jgi:hypothetical protein
MEKLQRYRVDWDDSVQALVLMDAKNARWRDSAGPVCLDADVEKLEARLAEALVDNEKMRSTIQELLDRQTGLEG